MSIIEAIIFGIVQAVTEFLPVSSSGHLAILDRVGAVEGSFENDVLINIGTLLALLVYFFSRIKELVKNVFNNSDYRLPTNIVISTIPAVLVGYFFIDVFSSDSLRSGYIIALMLFLIGLFFIWADKAGSTIKNKQTEVHPTSALAIGLAQVVAFIPGTSRSGSTILAGKLFGGLSYKQATEYSFLIGIPVVLGAVVRVLFTSEASDFISGNTGSFIVGNLVSFAIGYGAIHFMLQFVAKHGLRYFGYYRIGLSVILLAILIFN